MADDQTDVNPYELARALLENGEALVADAELLLDHGRHARAAALSLMALEELSKIQLCVEAITEETPVPEARSREWTHHRDKFTGARALELAFLDEAPGLDRAQVQRSVAEDQRAKLACLYVDHSDGRIAGPADVDVDAAHLVDRARAAAAWLRRIVSQMSPEVMDAIRPYRDVLDRCMVSMVDENDLAGTIARLREVVEAGLPVPNPQADEQDS